MRSRFKLVSYEIMYGLAGFKRPYYQALGTALGAAAGAYGPPYKYYRRNDGGRRPRGGLRLSTRMRYGRSYTVTKQKRYRKRRVRGHFKRRMMWRRGRKSKSISPLIRLKNVTTFRHQFNWTAINTADVFADFSQLADKTDVIMPDEKECVNQLKEMQMYKNLQLVRISTRLDNFKIDRIVGTTVGTGPNAQYHEDKVTFTDPTLYFYRDSVGYGISANIKSGDYNDMAKRKCIRDCKDGFWWSTDFKTKTERLLCPAENIINLTKPAIMNVHPRLVDVLKQFAVLPKLYDAEGTDRSKQGIHSMGFGIGRPCPYSKYWFKDGDRKIERYVTDHLTFTLTSYVSIRGYGRNE